MAIAQREAEVVWEGVLARGTGSLTSGSGVLDGSPVTWAARTEGPNGKTSPEELVAAAHASCFAMALALVLGKVNATPEQLVVRALCSLVEVAGAPRITGYALEVRGRVSNLAEGAFAEAVEEASRLCPVSNALAGNVEITVEATFEGSEARTREVVDA
jgi:osmotically inducible protein OsmC